MNSENNQIIKFYLDDIKNIREELNWRVKVAYTSNITVFPAIITIATFFQSLELSTDNALFVSGVISLVLSMYVTLQVINRIVEKKN